MVTTDECTEEDSNRHVESIEFVAEPVLSTLSLLLHVINKSVS